MSASFEPNRTVITDVPARHHRLWWLAVAALCLLATACAATLPRVPTHGEISGAPLATTVDSPLARYYLEDYLGGRREKPEFDSKLDELNAQIGNMPSASQMELVSKESSVDTAALFYAQRVLSQPQNHLLRDEFLQELAKLQSADMANLDAQSIKNYRVVFIPGWLYVSKPWTGANFAKQRELFDRLGIEQHMILTTDNGTIEENAAIIAAELPRYLKDDKPVILISGSKGGPEIAEVLGRLLPAEQTTPIHGWINMCGAISGSALADRYTTGPGRVVANTLFHIWGWGGVHGLESMRTRRSQKRVARWHIPPHIFVVNYIGVPVSGTIIAKEFAKRFTYIQLREHGPNDGLVLIPDEIAPNSVTVAELGRAHFLSEPDIAIRTTALLRTVEHRLDTSPVLAMPDAAPPSTDTLH